MRTTALIFAAVLAAALAASATAQPGDPAKPAAAAPTALSELDIIVHRSTRVSGLDVTASRCPKIRGDAGAPTPRLVSSFPAKGAVVRPGLVIVRLTFDQPMTCKGYLAEGLTYRFPCPDPLPGSLITYDRRTFFTLCNAAAGTRYGIRVVGFQSLAGRMSATDEFDFQTSKGAKVLTQTEAMAQDDWIAAAERKAEAAEQ